MSVTVTHGFSITKENTTARGYGWQHQKARKAAANVHQDSDLCVRCGEALGPMGSHLHFDHTDDRTGYLGFAHARCNIEAGARRGWEIRITTSITIERN